MNIDDQGDQQGSRGFYEKEVWEKVMQIDPKTLYKDLHWYSYYTPTYEIT